MLLYIHLLTAFYLQVNHFSASESGFFLHQKAINCLLNNCPHSHQHPIQLSKQAKNRVSFVTIVTPTNPPLAPPLHGRGVDYSACCFQIAISNKLITDEHSAKRLTSISLVADEHHQSAERAYTKCRTNVRKVPNEHAQSAEPTCAKCRTDVHKVAIGCALSGYCG